MAEQENDHLVRNVAIAAGAITALVVAVLILPYLMRDTWELDNTARLSAKLEQADQLQQSDPLAAYKTYEEVLKETQQHKVTNQSFSEKLASAGRSRDALYQKVKDKILAEEAEKQRQAQEEARRAAAEKQRIAEEQEQARAIERAQKIAEDNHRAEEKRRKEAVQAYRNVPQSARNAANTVKRLEARTEVGINYADYSRAVGEAWGEVKVFVESPEGKAVPDFSLLLTNAIADYKTAITAWHWKIEWSSLDRGVSDALGELQQLCWERAGKRLQIAEALLDPEKTEKALAAIARAEKNDEDFNAKLHGILAPNRK
jgi:hypothetical protein